MKPARQHVVIAIAAAAAAGLAVWLSTWSGDEGLGGQPVLRFVLTAIPAIAFAGLWLAAAAGFGGLIRRALFPESAHARVLQVGGGVALLLVLDAALGALGVLQIGGGLGAWALIVAGGGLLLWSAAAARRDSESRSSPAHLSGWWIFAAAFPALAVLIVAPASAPGWLWSSEFGGYDALSYHLQLPREWMALGRVTPVEHNVYSFLPGFVEAAYYHLHLLCGEGHDFIYAAQMLHAMITITCGLALWRLTDALTGSDDRLPRLAGLVAAALFLGTPWVIVVGTLGYNELFVTLLLVCGLIALFNDVAFARNRTAILLGLLCGAACGAKLTAIGFVAAPLAIVLLWRFRDRPLVLLRIGAIAAGIALIALSPYLLRDWLHAGNPVFPFATGIFGEAHWTQQQAEMWQRGHAFEGGPLARLAGLWNQLLRFGIGPAPAGFTDVWKPQWSILWWLGAGGFVACMFSRKHWSAAILLGVVIIVQLLFWMLFTHLKSRFMLPAAVPLAALAALGALAVLRFLDRWPRFDSAVNVIAAALGGLYVMQPVILYRSEPRDAEAPASYIGLDAVFTAEGLDPQQQSNLATQIQSAFINTQLLPGARVLLVGEAAPLYYDLARIDYTTTWDRGPLSRALQAHGEDAAAIMRSLRESGYTHVLINLDMLDRWQRSGWADAVLDPDSIANLFERSATPVASWNDGSVRLYRIE